MVGLLGLLLLFAPTLSRGIWSPPNSMIPGEAMPTTWPNYRPGARE
jgi:hypothetical protein